MKQIYNNLPIVIKRVLLISEGWLVGSAPRKLMNNEPVKDYDILVPSKELYQLSLASINTMNIEITVNTFGGLKVQFENISMDIWPEELGHFINTATKFDYAYNLKRAKLIKND